LFVAVLAAFSLTVSGCDLDALLEELGIGELVAEAADDPAPEPAPPVPSEGEDDPAPSTDPPPVVPDDSEPTTPEDPTTTPPEDPTTVEPEGDGMEGHDMGDDEMDHSMLPDIDLSTLMAPNPGSGQPGNIPPNINGSSNEEKIRVRCLPAKMAFVDPMVAPGNPNFWHLHTFFGNTAIDHNSDLDALSSSGSSTCGGGILNRSSYWVPTMVDERTGAALQPVHLLTYYHTAHRPHPFEAYPDGLRLLTGDATSTNPQVGAGVDFRCKRQGAADDTSNIIVPCEPGNELWQMVTFPNCWDGNRLDSPNHRDHMAFMDQRGNCPNSHPHKLAELKLHVVYQIPNGTNPAVHWRLSSDAYSEDLPGGYSAHGDYVFGWDTETARRWHNTCISGSQDCGTAQPVR
jgi:hypothetical protein